MNQNSLQVITTRNFNGLAFDCYKGNDDEDFWATREQIGRLLGYNNPVNAVMKIHNRNKARLDTFSTWVKMSQVEGTRTVTRDVIAYSFKGLLEICRWSNQPKANQVIDFIWGIADDLRRGKLQVYQNAVLKEREKVAALQEQIDSNRCYTTLGKIVADMPGAFTVKEASDFLLQHGITDKGHYKLYEALRNMGLLSRQKGHWNKPTRKGIDKGIAFLALDRGEYRLSTRTVLTAKGLKDILSMFFEEQYPLIALIEKQPDPENEVVVKNE